MAGKSTEKFTFTTVPNSLRKFLKGIPSRNVPPKVTQRYLESIGLKSSNDRSIIGVLKFVGLIDGSGVPTETYKEFRDAIKGPVALGQSIRTAYAPVFATYEDAYKQSDEVLQNFIRANTSVAERSVQYMLATFRALCEFGKFEGSAGKDGGGIGGGAEPGKPSGPQGGKYPGISLNFEIVLPQSTDTAVYDAIFDAMTRALRKLQ